MAVSPVDPFSIECEFIVARIDGLPVHIELDSAVLDDPAENEHAAILRDKELVVVIDAVRTDARRKKKERRDVRADFKRYFGLDVAQVDGVAVMTDCDDAGGATRAWYGDVRFSKGVRGP